MSTRSAATRLRKTFQYPSSDSSSSELDEEHQEKLISDLQTSDTAKNNLYRKIFLALPLLALLFSLTTTFASASSARARLLSLLSATSLACSGYILHYMPIEKPARRGKIPQYQIEAAKGPVERYLPWLNGALVAVLGLAAALSYRKGNLEDAGREILPAIIFGVTIFVREQLAPLDLEELQKARYELKGA
ncbi:uncharacterized protein MYCFIDRAFT_202992 [Pseudocercospora fijiensis CIRAD86]|uniref:Uncharacterized protein n=1 Tax=Pseudocercospora fijiensis (strain CIRAD86) TaxID=383855 RepID=M2ZZN1_PSEFD|nr:uncharacterized protein MYCFIDRAFT_202992 [Pseudocercospora fijiensis CIRAD86]EME84369.1 hypothetical protein MYCFIDRAFT_202992 [Pseudocercospora fijiensis CIRAD86]